MNSNSKIQTYPLYPAVDDLREVSSPRLVTIVGARVAVLVALAALALAPIA